MSKYVEHFLPQWSWRTTLEEGAKAEAEASKEARTMFRSTMVNTFLQQNGDDSAAWVSTEFYAMDYKVPIFEPQLG